MQEALTNSAVTLEPNRSASRSMGPPTTWLSPLKMTVRDLILSGSSGRGLGLLNIEERVRELGGRVEFLSSPSRGTLLRCEIPVPKEVTT